MLTGAGTRIAFMKPSAIWKKSAVVALLALSSSSPMLAQSNARPVTIRTERLVQSESETLGGKPFLQPPVNYRSKANEVLAAEPVSSNAPMLRSTVEPSVNPRMKFESVPGGIVLGLDARVLSDRAPETWTGSHVVETERGWCLQLQNGTELLLPTERASVISAALVFARSADVGDWLVDIDGAGSIHLAYPMKNTLAGMIAARADLAPQFCRPIFAGGKSLIVDRDVRVRVEGERINFEADLEVRFYRPERNPGGEELAERVGTIPLTCSVEPMTGALSLTAPDGPRLAELAGYLERLSALAGWIGFFRWADGVDVQGLDEFQAALAAEAAPVLTPLRVDRTQTAAWVSGRAVQTPAVIPDWMQEHRERALKD